MHWSVGSLWPWYVVGVLDWESVFSGYPLIVYSAVHNIHFCDWTCSLRVLKCDIAYL